MSQKISKIRFFNINKYTYKIIFLIVMYNYDW